MCAERIQRILTAIMLGIALMFLAQGAAGNALFLKIGVALQVFIMLMMLVWAFTNFCPSLWFFTKVFGPCDWNKDSSNE
ncbi:phosphoribosylaminoimidazole synthetase [Hydrogenimonas sp.]|uniref:phosphoribosylaminoimidazole synthetase n=1 Tax=Hydrogenimonas sp. TaxID=2231112 RepID=UPI00260FF99D|nr:phosphoribosylaminoimidazole synthetase [Hydrogenimonas sp.]